MGKTRLVSTASTLVAGSTFVAAGSCLPLSSQVPLLPVTDVLRAAYDVDDGQWLKDALTDCAPYVAGSLQRLLPELDLVLGSAPASRRRVGAAAAVRRDRGDADRAGVAPSVRGAARGPALGRLRHPRPRRAPARAPRSRAGRGHLAPRRPGHARGHHTVVVAGAAIADVHDSGPAAAGSRGDRGAGRAARWPVRATRGWSTGSTDGARASRCSPSSWSGSTTPQDLPRLLADLLDQRLSGLGASASAIARALGVADRSLPDALLADVAGLAPAELAAGLRELADRRLLRPATGHHVELRHPLLAEAIRRRLVALEVTDEHRRLGAALSRSEAPSPAEVAEHWQRAEDPAEEVVWRVRAAQAASRRFALAQAAEQWRRALALWPESWGAVAGVGKHDAYLDAMDALLFTDVDAAWAVAEEAMLDLTDRDGMDAAATYRRAASIKHWLDDPEGAVELVEHAIRIHRSAPPSVEYVRALHEHDSLLFALGRYDAAAATAARALDICAHLDAPVVHRSLLIQQSNHDIDQGDLERAMAHLDEAAGLELTGPDPEGDIYLGIMRTETLREAGRVGDEVAEAGRPGLESAASWGLETFPAHVLRGNVSAALRLSGQVGQAAALIDPLITEAEPTREDASIHAERACLDMLRGRSAEALARFDSMAALPIAVLSNRIESAEHLRARICGAVVHADGPRPPGGVLRDRRRPPPRRRSGADPRARRTRGRRRGRRLPSTRTPPPGAARPAAPAARTGSGRPVRALGLLRGQAGTRGGVGRRDGAPGRPSHAGAVGRGRRPLGPARPPARRGVLPMARRGGRARDRSGDDRRAPAAARRPRCPRARPPVGSPSPTRWSGAQRPG